MNSKFVLFQQHLFMLSTAEEKHILPENLIRHCDAKCGQVMLNPFQSVKDENRGAMRNKWIKILFLYKNIVVFFPHEVKDQVL